MGHGSQLGFGTIPALPRIMSAQAAANGDGEDGDGIFRELLDDLPDIAWSARLDGKLTFVSDNIYEICGIERAEALAAPHWYWLARIHPDDVAAVEGTLRRLASTRDTVSVDFRWQRPDQAWIRLRLRARTSRRGGVTHIDGLMADVTEERRRQEQLEQAHVAEALGRMTDEVAHDYNNVLASILVFGQCLAKDLSELDPRRSDALEIVKQAERASALTYKLLMMSRQQAHAESRVDLRDLVLALRAPLEHLLGDDVDVELTVDSEPSTIAAERSQIEHVLLSLAQNSRDAMPKGGTFGIQLMNVDLDQNQGAREGVPAGRYVRLVLSDTGEGMDEETRRNAFQPFFTTKPTGRGQGLGLSACYGIVRRSGGFIRLDSPPGGGTTVTIHLPRRGDE